MENFEDIVKSEKSMNLYMRQLKRKYKNPVILNTIEEYLQDDVHRDSLTFLNSEIFQLSNNEEI